MCVCVPIRLVDGKAVRPWQRMFRNVSTLPKHMFLNIWTIQLRPQRENPNSLRDTRMRNHGGDITKGGSMKEASGGGIMNETSWRGIWKGHPEEASRSRHGGTVEEESWRGIMKEE